MTKLSLGTIGLIALAVVSATRDRTPTPASRLHVWEPPTVPTDYSKFPGAVALIGVVLDMDSDTREHAADFVSGPRPLLKIRVSDSFPAGDRREVVLDMLYPAKGSGGMSRLKIGDRVLVTASRAGDPANWSCGRLRACEESVTEVWYGIEVFRDVRDSPPPGAKDR